MRSGSEMANGKTARARWCAVDVPLADGRALGTKSAEQKKAIAPMIRKLTAGSE
jgi:hypothetical protein